MAGMSDMMFTRKLKFSKMQSVELNDTYMQVCSEHARADLESQFETIGEAGSVLSEKLKGLQEEMKSDKLYDDDAEALEEGEGEANADHANGNGFDGQAKVDDGVEEVRRANLTHFLFCHTTSYHLHAARRIVL